MADLLSDEEKTFRHALDLEEAGRPEEALELLAALAARRENPRHLLAYAQCLTRAGGNWEEAVSCLRSALAIDPKYFEGGIRLFLADLLMEHGCKAEAIEQWQVVAKMAPDNSGYGAVPDEAIIRLRQHAV